MLNNKGLLYFDKHHFKEPNSYGLQPKSNGLQYYCCLICDSIAIVIQLLWEDFKRLQQQTLLSEVSSFSHGVFSNKPCLSILWRLEAIASRFEAIAIRLEAIASRLEAIASRLEAIAIRLEAIAGRLEAIASRLEAIAIRLEGIPSN